MEIPPDISDIFFIMVLVLPGYFSLKIIRNIGYLKRKLSDTELLYLSLGCSIIIYVLTGFALGINDFNEIKNIVIQPDSTLRLTIITISVGVLIGIIFRLWRNYVGYVPDDAWTSVLKEERDIEDPWIIVYTSNGEEYKGALNFFGVEHESRDLSIVNPIKILRDDEDYVIGEMDCGEEMYFTEKDVLRILFMTKDSDDEESSNANKPT